MTFKKPKGIYRPILSEALRLTWQRKRLWVFGLFAGLISTGGILDVTLHAIRRVHNSGVWFENWVDQSFVGYRVFESFIQQAQTVGTRPLYWIVTTTAFILITLIVCGVLSQIALILNSTSQTSVEPTILRHQALSHFWRVFTLDVLTKLASTLLVILASLPFILYAVNASQETFWLLFVDLCVFIPAVIIVQMLSMLALIDVVDHNTHPLHAITTSWRLFRHQWIATLEFSMLLFFSVLVAGAVFLFALSLLIVPFSLVYTSTLFIGSPGLFVLSNVLLGMLFVGIVLVFCGAAVTFQYTAWHKFYKRGMHKQHGLKRFAKVLRWLRLA